MVMRRTWALLPLLVLLPSHADTVIDPPTGSGDVVVRISRGGGMTTAENAFDSHPDLLVTGDGTVYRSGEHGLETFHVDHAQVVALLRDADDAGLLDRSTDARTATGIMDAGSTNVELDAGRVRRTHDVYALGSRPGFGGLKRYVGRTLDWAASQPATAYQPTRYRVLTEDDDGYHCSTSDEQVDLAGAVVAMTAMLPGDRCEAEW
jgi:hypothetical protein